MTDLTKLRNELRRLRRCDLLIIAERAAELVSRADLKPLLSDFMHVDVLVVPGTKPAPLIEEIQKFYDESCDGRYFEQFEANAKKYEKQVEDGFMKAAKFLHMLHIYRIYDLPYQSQIVPLAEGEKDQGH